MTSTIAITSYTLRPLDKLYDWILIHTFSEPLALIVVFGLYWLLLSIPVILTQLVSFQFPPDNPVWESVRNVWGMFGGLFGPKRIRTTSESVSSKIIGLITLIGIGFMHFLLFSFAIAFLLSGFSVEFVKTYPFLFVLISGFVGGGIWYLEQPILWALPPDSSFWQIVEFAWRGGYEIHRRIYEKIHA